MKTSQRILFGALALLVVTPFIYIDFFYYSQVTSRIILWSIAMLGVIGAAWYEMYHNETFKKHVVSIAQHPVIFIYTLFVGWLLVRGFAVFSPDVWWGSLERTDGIVYHLGWLIACIIAGAFIKSVANVYERLAQIFIAVAITATTVSGVMFLFFPLNPVESDLPRFAGSVGNPLYLAGMLLVIPLFVTFVTDKYLRALILIITAVTLVATETRGAYLSLFIGAAAFCVFYQRIYIKIRVAIVSLALVAIIFTTVGVATDKIVLQRIATVQSRIALWKSGLQEVARNPLIGYGMGEHVNAVDRGTLSLKSIFRNDISDTTHSAYIDLALQGGIIEVLLFFIFIVVALRTILRHDEWSDVQRSMAAATLIAYCVFIATSPLITWLWLPFILVIAPTLHKNIRTKYNKISERVIGVCGVLIAVSASVLIVYTTYAGIYLGTVKRAIARVSYVDLPQEPLFVNKALPYAKEYFIAQLRITMPQIERAVAPSYDQFVQQIRGNFFVLERMSYRHPQDDLVAATWLSQFVTSGLSQDPQSMLETSARFQLHALTLNPDRPQTYFQLADTYRELSRLEDALALLKTFKDRNPEWPEGHLFYGVMLDIAGKKMEANEQAQLALQLRPLEQWTEEHQTWLKEYFKPLK